MLENNRIQGFPMFSVIVPIYNVERYLPECIESVIKQDYGNFELILVVDGSPDNSLMICDEYAARDDRIKVISKENGGSTSARKAAAEVASGDYVICIDGDDFVEQGYFACAAKSIAESDADIVVFGFNRYLDGRKTYYANYTCPGFFTDKEYEGIREDYLFSPKRRDVANDGSLIYSLGVKFIRRRIYVEAQRQVDNSIVIGEDMLCTAICLHSAKSLMVVDKAYYNYRILNNSISHKYNPIRLRQCDNTVASLMALKYIQDSRISGFAFNSLWNQLATAAKNAADVKDFIEIARETGRYQSLYKTAMQIDSNGLNLKSKLKVFIIKHHWHGMIYKYFNR